MNNPTKYYSAIQESSVAKFLDGKVVTGSGSRATHPGDIELGDWLCECKTHLAPKNYILFKQSEWRKICDEATSKFKHPVLIVDNGSQDLKFTWCLYPMYFDRSQYPTTNYPNAWKTNIKFDLSELQRDVIYLMMYGQSITPMCISSIDMFKMILAEG